MINTTYGYQIVNGHNATAQEFTDQICKLRSEGWVYAGQFTVVPDGPGSLLLLQPMELVSKEETNEIQK